LWWGWPFIFFLFFFPQHGFFGWLSSLAVLVLLGLLISAFVLPLLSSAGFWGNGSSRNNRSYQQPYRPSQQQPYQQGYQPRQPSAEAYQEGGQQYQYPQQSQYDQYEQPHAQYPQEIPPMEQ
jgi:hypothetical protein